MKKLKKYFFLTFFLLFSCKKESFELTKNQTYVLVFGENSKEACQEAHQILDEIKIVLKGKNVFQKEGPAKKENPLLEAQFIGLVELLAKLEEESSPTQEDLFASLASLNHAEIISEIKNYLPQIFIPVRVYFADLINFITQIKKFIAGQKVEDQNINLEGLKTNLSQKIEELENNYLTEGNSLAITRQVAARLKDYFEQLRECAASLMSNNTEEAKEKLAAFEISFKGQSKGFNDPAIRERIIYTPYKEALDRASSLLDNCVGDSRG